MELNLKFTASIVKDIEDAKRQPIANCIGDQTINGLAFFIQKAQVNENGKQGVSNNVAISIIDEYLAGGKDSNDLLFEIIERLIGAGFLSKELDTAQMKSKVTDEIKKVFEA